MTLVVKSIQGSLTALFYDCYIQKIMKSLFEKKILTFILVLILTSCSKQNNYVKLTGYTMGTSYHITLEKNNFNTKELQTKIDKRLKKINQLMSTYIDDSELSIFNQNQTVECQKLSKETLFVIKNAIDISHKTNGKFDVTLAPLIAMWGFDKKDTQDIIPNQDLITSELNNIGFQKIIVENNCVKKSLPQLSINLSAIAKGYAVDEIAKIIQQHQIKNYLVEIGGEVANQGLNPKGKNWRIAIESPNVSERSIHKAITPKNLGIATSGNYRNYFEKDGKRYSHTIDPTTGYPITHTLASITVLHKQTMIADALATALLVMGDEAALKFAEQTELPIFMLIKDGDNFKEVHSTAFKQHLN